MLALGLRNCPELRLAETPEQEVDGLDSNGSVSQGGIDSLVERVTRVKENGVLLVNHPGTPKETVRQVLHHDHIRATLDIVHCRNVNDHFPSRVSDLCLILPR